MKTGSTPHNAAKKRDLRSIAWFLVVGSSAAAVHWAVVVACVQGWNWQPLLANIVGWLMAFAVSFTGHYRLSFRGHEAHWGTALRRFFLISAMGFGINEALYAISLSFGWRYDWALFIVLLAVAVLTYYLSRRWAFFRNSD